MKIERQFVAGVLLVFGLVAAGCSSSGSHVPDAGKDGATDRPLDLPTESGSAPEVSSPDVADADVDVGGAAGGDAAGAAGTSDGGGAGTTGAGGLADGGDARSDGVADGGDAGAANGVACKAASECASGFCTDGYCCGSACTEPCKSCGLPSYLGRCVAGVVGPDDHCAGSCNALGCAKANGDACTSADQCASAICVDGVCCNNACTGECKACNIADKLGTCSTVAVGTPDPYCGSLNACATDGFCHAKNGTTCTSGTTCASGLCVDGVCCDTACTGDCKSCNLPGTEGTCTLVAPGHTEANCTALSACDGAGTCKKANGQSCAAASECGGNACNSNVCCAGAVCTAAQYGWTKTWGGTDYEFLYALGAAPDGGFMTAGTYRNGTNVEDIFLVRYDATGAETFERRFGGAKFDVPYGVAFFSDNSFVAGGDITSPTADLDPGAGTFTVTNTTATGFVSKYDAAGNFLWARTWGGTVHGEVYGVAVAPDDTVYVLGLFETSIDLDPTAGTDTRTASGQSGFVVKLSKDGAYLWGRVTSMVEFGDFAVGADGSVVYTDTFKGTADLDPTDGVDSRTAAYEDTYVTKLAADGSYLWSRVFKGVTALHPDVAIGTDGSIAVVGAFSGTGTFDPAGTVSKTSAGDLDVFVTKLDANGAHVWTQTTGGTGEEDAASVVFGPSGAVIVVGTFKTAFDSDPGPAIELQPRLSTAIGADVFVSAFSSGGVYQWTRTLPGWTNTDQAPSVMLAGGGLLIANTFGGVSYFDSASKTDYRSSVGPSDAYVTKLLP